jgi:glycosyltransferase involved in cell wall biosynthesis
VSLSRTRQVSRWVSAARLAIKNPAVAFARLNSENSLQISAARKLIQQGYEDLGFARLVLMAYGPGVSAVSRRIALREILVFAGATGRTQLAETAANHLMGCFESKRLRKALDTEINAILDQSNSNWSEARAFACFLRAQEVESSQQSYSMANFACCMPESIFTPAAVQTVQLAWLNFIFDNNNLQSHFIQPPAVSPLTFDDLPKTFLAKTTIADGPLISVLLPVFNAEKWIQTALEGLSNQTLQNLEILIIDDQSTDRTVDIVQRWSQNDSRFRLLQANENSGAFNARNLGLQEAKGEFVTVHDADDWSHPQKLEIQSAHLIRNPKVIANLSEGIRAFSGQLHFHRVFHKEYLNSNISSLMFRRLPIIEHIGFWDSVRFGGDSEFHERLIAQFGLSRVVNLKTGPLSFIRFHAESLTGSGFASTRLGMAGIRRFYVDSFKKWHGRISSGQTSAFLEVNGQNRPFAIPRLQSPRAIDYPEFDQVIVADLSPKSEDLNFAVEAIQGQTSRGGTIGLINLDAARASSPEIASDVLALINFEKVVVLFEGDSVTAQEVKVMRPESLTRLANRRPRVIASRIQLVRRESNIDAPYLSEIATKEFQGSVIWAVDTNEQS